MEFPARTANIGMRVTADEAERLKEMAWRERVRLSSWLRDLALREAARLERRRQVRESIDR